MPNSDDLPIDEQRRHFLKTATCALTGIGILCASTPLIRSWMPSAQALKAGEAIRVDISSLQPGQQMIVEWRGKPIWIIHRTPQMLQELSLQESLLRDPHSQVEQQPLYAQNSFRSIKPEYLVLVGLCTHLGCSPKYKPLHREQSQDWAGGFYCPCHGSTFDLAGRVFKNVPAPVNLEVPAYYFADEHTLVIGEHQSNTA